MIDLVKKMSPPLAATALVQEQLALALNRTGEASGRAGPTGSYRPPRRRAATYGILGRVYKDRWVEANNAGETIPARALLDKAIDAYLRGFESTGATPIPASTLSR